MHTQLSNSKLTLILIVKSLFNRSAAAMRIEIKSKENLQYSLGKDTNLEISAKKGKVLYYITFYN